MAHSRRARGSRRPTWPYPTLLVGSPPMRAGLSKLKQLPTWRLRTSLRSSGLPFVPRLAGPPCSASHQELPALLAGSPEAGPEIRLQEYVMTSSGQDRHLALHGSFPRLRTTSRTHAACCGKCPMGFQDFLRPEEATREAGRDGIVEAISVVFAFLAATAAPQAVQGRP